MRPALAGGFIIQQQLGRDHAGTACAARDAVTSQCVILKVAESPAEREYLRTEALILQQLEHPSVQPFVTYEEGPVGARLVLGYADGGDLLEFLRKSEKLPDQRVRHLFRQVLLATQHAHERGFIHRDIKLESILLSNGAQHLHLANWSLGGTWSPHVLQNKSCGSLHYSAPEICREGFYIGPEVDVWSLGVVLYALATRKLPFKGATPYKVHKRILIAQPYYSEDMSAELVDLLRRMLDPDRELRATIPQILTSRWMNPPPASAVPAPPPKLLEVGEPQWKKGEARRRSSDDASPSRRP